MNMLPDFVHWFLPLLPGALVWLAGAIIAVFTWNRHPRVSLLALLACLLTLFNYVVGNGLQYWALRGRSGNYDVAWWMSVIGLFRTGLSVASSILILCAVFTGRRATYQPPPVDAGLRPPRREPAEQPGDSQDIQKGPRWD